MASPSIAVNDVSLAYRLARNRSGTLKEFLVRMLKRQVDHEKLLALKDVSFEVHRGEVLGVIGANGAGKSTLMKIIARVLPPTHGRVIVRGSVAPMIELGAGFNPELTGYENIVLYGTLLGYDPVHMRERAPIIAEWAGLEDFLDVPIRSYSSGMLARLGFGIASDTAPDVLLVDEVLSVGDQAFQRRSSERMVNMIGRGAAVVLVSHSMPTILEMADRVLWLDHGIARALGDPDEVVDGYLAWVGQNP
jgi:ABC-type polysaccharide/polyol phosphate transport system ATPase subunit